MGVEEIVRLVGDVQKAEQALVDRVVTAVVAVLQERLPPVLLTRAETAERCRCSPDTIDKMVKDGSIRARRFGTRVLIDASSLRPVSDVEAAALARAALRPVAGRGGGR